jgi:hypothetical protein
MDEIELCPHCRTKYPELSDVLRRTGLRQAQYARILVDSHLSVRPREPHRLDVSRNYVEEHLPGIVPGADCEFRVKEIGDHRLRICIFAYGTAVVTILHPRQELAFLLDKGHVLTPEAQVFLRQEPPASTRPVLPVP